MSNTTIFAYLILFTFTFTGLSILYGVVQPQFTQAITGPQNCLFNNQPPGPCSFPPFNPPQFSNVTQTTSSQSAPFPQCMLFIPSCFGGVVGSITNTGQAILNGLSFVGYGIGMIPIYSYVFFNKMLQVLLLVNATFSVMNTDYGVPFLSNIMYAFIFLLVVFGGAIIKPGGHGQ